MKKLLLIFAVVFTTSQAWSATYYIDPTCSSSGRGTTTTCGANGPFKTWTEVNWAAGNTYSQKGGTTYHGTIIVGASGVAGNPITINSYGTGKASLSGEIIITPESWGSPDANGVYRQTGFGYGMLEDDVFLKWCLVEACASGMGNYRYVWGGSSPEYYKPTTGTPADHVTKKMRSCGIQLGANSYITITDFKLIHYNWGITGTGLTAGQTNNHITVKGNDFSDIQFGVWINFNQATSTGVTITENTFDYVMSSIELQNQGDCKSHGIHNSVNISYNSITHCSQIRGSNGVYNWGDVNTAGWDEEGIGLQDLSNSNIHHNSITGRCRGIVLFTCAGDDSFNNSIYKNYIYTDKEPLMLNPRTIDPPANSFYNNSVHYNILIGGRLGWATAMYLGNVPNPSTRYNKIYNNTVIPATNGIFFPAYSDYYEVKNNIVHGGHNYLIVQIGPAPAHIIYDHNLYHSGMSWSAWYVNNKGLNWTRWKSLGVNYDAHSPTPANPLFTDAAGGVYTLTSSSPAKYTGVNVGMTTDYVGNPVHNPPSIGAYDMLDQ